MKTQNQSALRMYVRAREEFQATRKRMDNRLGLKADGTQQKLQDSRFFSPEDIHNFAQIRDQAKQQEKEVEKMLKKVLKRFPIYNQWLSKIKGIREVSAGWLLGEFDIEQAETVSKMWQYAGLNPGMVCGKKRVPKNSYKNEMGQIVTEIDNIRSGGTDYIIKTDILIRGDRALEGFVLPYNKNLRTYLLGVMAPNFIKSRNSYAIEFYYPYKNRLENEKRPIVNEGKPRQDDGKLWCDVSKGHRNSAAKRYMIKMFLKDLYLAWREIENLPVRPPYAEEYLNKVHHFG